MAGCELTGTVLASAAAGGIGVGRAEPGTALVGPVLGAADTVAAAGGTGPTWAASAVGTELA